MSKPIFAINLTKGNKLMELIEQLQYEINELNNSGKLKWLDEQEQQDALLENSDTFLEVLREHSERSRIFSFKYKHQNFSFMIHYDSEGAQEFIKFLWPTGIPLEQLCENT